MKFEKFQESKAIIEEVELLARKIDNVYFDDDYVSVSFDLKN